MHDGWRLQQRRASPLLASNHLHHPCSYVDYVLETLSRRELFQWLSLAPLKFWHTLLWRDRWALVQRGRGRQGKPAGLLLELARRRDTEVVGAYRSSCS